MPGADAGQTPIASPRGRTARPCIGARASVRRALPTSPGGVRAHARVRARTTSAGPQAVFLDQADEDVATGQVQRAPGGLDAAAVLVEGLLYPCRIQIA